MDLRIRTATERDLPTLAERFAGTVRAIGPEHYDAAEVEDWASRASKPERFRNFILGPRTFVAEDTSGIIGFAGIEPTGHIASLYVRRDRVRRGVGTRLLRTVLDHAERHGIDPLTAEASVFSLPLFRRFGFHVDQTERVEKDGAAFTKYFVRKAAEPAVEEGGDNAPDIESPDAS